MGNERWKDEWQLTKGGKRAVWFMRDSFFLFCLTLCSRGRSRKVIVTTFRRLKNDIIVLCSGYPFRRMGHVSGKLKWNKERHQSDRCGTQSEASENEEGKMSWANPEWVRWFNYLSILSVRCISLCNYVALFIVRCMKWTHGNSVSLLADHHLAISSC